MFIILSQNYVTKSTYDDNLFEIYHYPNRYKNAIHEGDYFIYHQGDSKHADHRYYYGCGRIGKITESGDGTYRAELIECKQFEKHVPLFYAPKSYFESIDYQEAGKKKPAPSWQSAIRPVSQKGYEAILSNAGKLLIPETDKNSDMLVESITTGSSSHKIDIELPDEIYEQMSLICAEKGIDIEQMILKLINASVITEM